MKLSKLLTQFKFDYVDSDITDEKFILKSDGLEPTELVHFGKDMSNEDVLKELDNRGLAPARIEHLIQYAIKNPEYTEFIVALGSSCVDSYGCRYSPVLDQYGRLRDLYLKWIDSDWSGFCRFLALKQDKALEPLEPQTLADTRTLTPLGIELRDYFAAKALTITDNVKSDMIGQQAVNLCLAPEEKAARIAKCAYLIADAMLKERAKDIK